MTDMITTFFDAWGMSDADARSAAIHVAIAETATYADPRHRRALGRASGAHRICRHVCHTGPGAVAEVTNTDTRDGVTRATIAFKMPNGMEQSGQYFVEHGENDLITRMVGFVGTGS